MINDVVAPVIKDLIDNEFTKEIDFVVIDAMDYSMLVSVMPDMKDEPHDVDLRIEWLRCRYRSCEIDVRYVGHF